MKAILLALTALAAASPALADSRAEITQHMQDMEDALVPGTVAVWDKYLDPTVIYAEENDSYKGKAEMLKEVQPLTGYIRGGVTVLGAKKEYLIYADDTIELWDLISVSAGVRGMQILIAPADYLRATKATLGDIARGKG